MTHNHPTVSPPQAQETTRDIIVRLARYMLQQDRARASAQALVGEHQATINRMRGEIEQAREILDALEGETLVEAANDLAREHQTTHEAYNTIHNRYWKEAVPSLAAANEYAASLERQLGETQVGVFTACREPLAAYAHEAWSGWMRYLFEKCSYTEFGEAVIPDWAVERWKRQSSTTYADLPEAEKESDRAEADKMLRILRRLAEGGLTDKTTE